MTQMLTEVGTSRQLGMLAPTVLLRIRGRRGADSVKQKRGRRYDFATGIPEPLIHFIATLGNIRSA